MKLVLLFALCGAAIAATVPYGNNFTSLETKITGGIDTQRSDDIRMANALVSIEVNQTHMWTGAFCQNNMVYTSARVAEKIRNLMRTGNAASTIEACYFVTPDNKKCVGINSVGLNADYLSYNFRRGTLAMSFNPHDIAILMVDIHPTSRAVPWKSFINGIIRMSGEVYYAIGWEFQNEPRKRHQKFLLLDEVERDECLKSYGVCESEVEVIMECFRPHSGTFQKEDIGALIKYNSVIVGILTYTDEDGRRPAVITRFRQVPCSQWKEEWLFDKKIDEFHASLILSTSQKTEHAETSNAEEKTT